MTATARLTNFDSGKKMLRARPEMRFWVGQASCLPVTAASSRELMFARLIIPETSGRMPEEPAGWKPALHPEPSIASWREHSFGANSEFQILKSVFHPCFIRGSVSKPLRWWQAGRCGEGRGQSIV